MATTNIDKVFGQIEKDFVEISKKAAKEAANKAQKDIRIKADKFIDEYYEYNPKVYKQRKKALYKLVENFYKESETGDGLMIEFGVKYNSSNIMGAHTSNSWYRKSGTHWIPRLSDDFDFDSQNNGIPSATWITEKFLSGIHPSGKIGDDGGVADRESPDEKMQEFFDNELNDKIVAYMNTALLNAIKAYF